MFTGRQVYEDKSIESDVDDDIDPIDDDKDSCPIVIDNHLNNPLIEMNLKVNNNKKNIK